MHASNGVFSGIITANAFYNQWQTPNSGTTIDPSNGTSVVIPIKVAGNSDITLPSAASYNGMMLTIGHFVTAFTRTYMGPCTIIPASGERIYINESLGNDVYITDINSIKIYPNRVYRLHAVAPVGSENIVGWFLEGDLKGCDITYNGGTDSYSFSL
jgi:hypothetical protein